MERLHGAGDDEKQEGQKTKDLKTTCSMQVYSSPKQGGSARECEASGRILSYNKTTRNKEAFRPHSWRTRQSIRSNFKTRPFAGSFSPCDGLRLPFDGRRNVSSSQIACALDHSMREAAGHVALGLRRAAFGDQRISSSSSGGCTAKAGFHCGLVLRCVSPEW